MVKVDKDKCIGCGSCVAICSEGFQMKNGKAVVIKEVPCSTEASESCPVNAISI